MAHYLTLAGRAAAIVNLDPANEAPPYEAALDVRDLVSLEAAMAAHGLGPNGGLLFCLDYLAANLDWLVEGLAPLAGAYVLFDLPGQTELFTMHPALPAVIAALTSGKVKMGAAGAPEGDPGQPGMAVVDTSAGAPPPRPQPSAPPAPPALAWRLAAVHLLDAVLCTDPAKYLAGCLDALGAMLHLELPHLNLLSKVDRLRGYGRLAFDLPFYARAGEGLEAVAAAITAGGGARGRGPAWGARHARLTASLAECVADFALLRFLPCAIEDEGTVGRVAAAADAAAGWVPHPGAGLPGTDRDGALPPGVGAGDEDAFLEEVAAKYGLPAADDEWEREEEEGDEDGG